MRTCSKLGCKQAIRTNGIEQHEECLALYLPSVSDQTASEGTSRPLPTLFRAIEQFAGTMTC